MAKSTLAAAAAIAKPERSGRIALTIDFAAIKLRALVVVGQQVIGAGYFAKSLGGVGLVLVAIGMKLFGQPSIGRLDVLFAGAARDAEDGIGVCHDDPS